jgi:hypothetical protein
MKQLLLYKTEHNPLSDQQVNIARITNSKTFWVSSKQACLLKAFIDLKDYIQEQKQSSPVTRHGDAWGERSYSSYSFTTSALDGGEW